MITNKHKQTQVHKKLLFDGRICAILGKWVKKDSNLKVWLIPQLERLSTDGRKSVAARAKKYLKVLA